jgi:hypothetical protein
MPAMILENEDRVTPRNRWNLVMGSTHVPRKWKCTSIMHKFNGCLCMLVLTQLKWAIKQCAPAKCHATAVGEWERKSPMVKNLVSGYLKSQDVKISVVSKLKY